MELTQPAVQLDEILPMLHLLEQCALRCFLSSRDRLEQPMFLEQSVHFDDALFEPEFCGFVHTSLGVEVFVVAIVSTTMPSSSKRVDAMKDEYTYGDDIPMCVCLVRSGDMTTAEYFATPESLMPTELAFGILHVRDAPFVPHQKTVGSFFTALREFVRANRLGSVWVAPLDIVLDAAQHLVVQPDVSFVSTARAAILRERVYGPPDLVVEVLSPRPRVGDFGTRLGWLGAYGVRECWAYHQAQQQLEMIRFGDGRPAIREWCELEDLVTSPCLPGFAMTLNDILAK
jgi:Uma2 family endonuclease